MLAEADESGADRYLLGGDYAFGTLGDWSRTTLRRLRELPDALWLRGNGERWLVEPPDELPSVAAHFRAARRELEAEVDRLYALPTQVELDGVFYCHGSPLSDVESFAAEPQPGEERLLAGVRERTVVFGHSHLQFRRPGPEATDLVNPGSVGMPLDGDTRAAWALLHDDGSWEFRRTEYDLARTAAALRRAGGDLGEWAAQRIERGSD